MITKREISLALVVACVGSIALFIVTQPRRQEKKRYACYSNLKQIGLALMLYAQDNDDTFPLASSGRDGSNKWMDVVFPYFKSAGNFTCPSDNVNRAYRFGSEKSYGNYVINNAYFLPGDAQTPPTGIRLEKIVSASYTVLVTDGENDFQFAWPDAQHTPPVLGDDPFQLGSIRGRHGSGFYRTALALGCDGSCSTALSNIVRQKKIVEGRTVYSAFTIEDDEP